MGILGAEFSQCLLNIYLVDKESDSEAIRVFKEFRQITDAVMEQGSIYLLKPSLCPAEHSFVLMLHQGQNSCSFPGKIGAEPLPW